MTKVKSPITTHILDTTKGLPAKGVDVILEQQAGKKFIQLAKGKTNQDGRIEDLLTPGSTVNKGVYRLTFMTGKYFKGNSFYPYVQLVFEVKNPEQHYHVPLLLNPFGLTTYRGT